jgi:drug/metabolite transporter (DMT)-like permease
LVLLYLTLGLTVISTVIYHLAQKSTPASAHPIFALAVTYAVATLTCLALLAVSPLRKGWIESFRDLNWASFVLALAVVGIEIGYLLAYRAGWAISLADIASNSAVGLILLPIGLFLFRERISTVNLAGVGVCLVGLILLNWR